MTPTGMTALEGAAPSLGGHGFGHRPTLAEGGTRSQSDDRQYGRFAVVRRPRLDEVGRRAVDRRDAAQSAGLVVR